MPRPLAVAALSALALLAACSPRPADAPTPAPSATASARPSLNNPEFLERFAATNRFRLGQPGAITVTPQGDAVLFLRSAGPRSFVQDLWLFDIATGRERVLLTADQILGGQEERLTAEELARRERARSSSRGIAGYQLSKDGRQLLVPLSGRLFVIDLADRSAPKVRELKSDAGFPIDPRFSPDGRLVAAVRSGDLFVLDAATGAETRLTTGATASLTHGTAEFVAQEEMDRSRGYWFSPDSTRVLYQRTDTSALETFTIADPANPGKPAQTWPYPRAGKANADVTLGIVPVAGGATTWITWDRAAYPYVTRVHWPRNAPLTILVQNREQTEQVLLRVDERTGATSPLLRETDPAWINLTGDFPKWLPDGSGFLWMTEQAEGSRPTPAPSSAVATLPPVTDGWSLQLRNADGRVLATIVDGSQQLTGFVGFSPVPASDGPESGTGVPPVRPTHVIVERSPDAIRSELWVYPLRSREAPRPLVPQVALAADGAVLSDHADVWVHTRSDREGNVAWTVRRGLVGESTPLGELRSIADAPPFTPRPEFTTVTAAGTTMNAVIIRPRDFAPGRAYPVLNAVYGGPHSNQVNAPARPYLLHQWIADQGFIVVALDARGTPRRGRAWERVIKGNLIDVPLAEQAAGTLALCDRYPEMDRARIGIYGWSFGGYFSAMAAMRRPDVFKAGVAGAPVADWADYDTFYTERYMGLPAANAEGYRASSVLTYTGGLRVPLLIVHGTADDNVYMINGLRMADALFRAGKDFDFLPLSGFTHMVAEPQAVERLWSRVAEFFIAHLRCGRAGGTLAKGQ